MSFDFNEIFKTVFAFANDLEICRDKIALRTYKKQCIFAICKIILVSVLFFFVDVIYTFSLNKNKTDKNVCVFLDNIDSSIKEYNYKNTQVLVLVGGLRDRIDCIKRNIPYRSINLIMLLINFIVIIRNSEVKMLLFEITFRKAITLILSINAKYLIMTNDTLPQDTIFIYIANILRVPSITIQDGWNKEDSKEIRYKMNNYYFVWGQYFRDIYCNKFKKKQDNIFILGYPYKIHFTNSVIQNQSINQKCVYFFGQPYLKISSVMFLEQKKIIHNVNNVCKKHNIKLVYRLHPGEDERMMKRMFPDVSFEKGNRNKENLYESFRRASICISINSTVLLEAVTFGKFCVQVYDRIFENYSSFQDIGLCYSVENQFSKIEDTILRYFNSQIVSFNCNDYFLSINKNLNKTFEILLESVYEKNKKEKAQISQVSFVHNN